MSVAVDPPKAESPVSAAPHDRRGILPAAVAAGIVAVVLVGLGVGNVLLPDETNTLTNVLLLISLGTAWNLVAGFGGQFSLGHSIFIGLGGYITAIVLVRTDVPLVAAVLLAATGSAVLGVVLSYPMIRLRGPYFAIGTLALALAVVGWMLNWELTGRSQAYSLPPADLLDVNSVYLWAALTAIVTFAAVFVTMHLPIGLRLLALREDEAGASSLGVRRTTTLLPIWALSAFLTGLVGAVLAIQRGTLDPQSAFSLQFTLDAIVVCLVGGLGTFSGPLVGAIIVYSMRQVAAEFDEFATLLEALAVIAVLRFIPGGVVASAHELFRRLRTPARAARAAAR